MSRYFRYLIPLFLFMGLVAFLLKGLDMNPREIPSPLIGKPMPEFNLPRLKIEGENITQEAFDGKVVLLNVWATWCVSCRAEHRTLVQLARTGKVDIYGLNWKDDRAGALTWLDQLGDPYVANAFDKVGRTAIDLGVYGAPETFVIDKKGMIRYKHAGPLSVQLLQDKILPLVDELNAEES